MKQVFSFGLLFVAWTVMAANSAQAGVDPVRAAGRDSLNVMYLFLKCYGCPADYKILQQMHLLNKQKVTLLDLKNASRMLNLRSVVVRLRPSDIQGLRGPVVSVIEPTVSTSRLILLIPTSRDNRVWYVDGTSACIQAMSADEFRRVWPGVALVPSETLQSFIIVSAVSVLGGYAVVRVWRTFNRRSQGV